MRSVLFLSLVGLAAASNAACSASFQILQDEGLFGHGSHTKAIKNLTTDTFALCCTACLSTAECEGWTWHPLTKAGEANQCKLGKGDTSGIHSSPSTISGRKNRPTPPPAPPAPTPAPTPGPKPQPPLGYQPNFVFVLTDDQDVELGGLEPMPKLRAMIGEQGLSHRHFYVNTPVCCPSRTEFLSGRYHHNVRDSKYLGKQGCGDEDVGKNHTCDCMRVNSSTMLFEETTYADYLQQAGYTTAYFGKYLNPPAMDIFCSGNGTKFPGWDHFMGMCNTAYYDITWNMDGALIKTGKEPHEYSTSIVGNKTIEFLHQHMNTSSERPFLVVAATRAPHKPQTPAPWYKDALPGTKNRKTPAFNCSVTGKVPWVARQKPIDSSEDTSYDTAFRQRWQTLLSVDDLVEGVVQALDELDLMPKTYFIFSSDHGYHLGHMRLSPGKRMHYEFDTRIPFLIRGPKIAANITATFIAGNVDMAPTFLELAGWRSSISPLMFQKPARMDGRSFAPMLLGSSPGSFAAAAAPSLPAAAAATSLPALARTPISAPPVLSSTWRDHFLLEFTGLSPWHGGRINDCPNNTYRALRFVSGSSAGNSSAKANAFENMPDSSGNMLYVEMTTSTDWWYDQINFRELYDMDKDPYQLINIFDNAPAATKQALATQMATEWKCKGVDCP